MRIIFWGSGINLVLILLLWFGWTGWRSLRLSLGADKRKPTDAAPWHIRLPPSLLPTVEILTQLHFRRLGETHSLLPSHATPIPTWIFLDETSTIVVEVIDFNSNIVVGFLSVCNDTAMVETHYPFGDSIELPDFHLQFVTTSLEDSYHEHCRQGATFAIHHGALQTMQNMADYLHWHILKRTRYAKRFLRRFVRESLIKVSALGYALVIVVSMLFIQGWHLFISEYLLVQLLSLLLPALVLSSFSTNIAKFDWTRFTKSKPTT